MMMMIHSSGTALVMSCRADGVASKFIFRSILNGQTRAQPRCMMTACSILQTDQGSSRRTLKLVRPLYSWRARICLFFVHQKPADAIQYKWKIINAYCKERVCHNYESQGLNDVKHVVEQHAAQEAAVYIYCRVLPFEVVIGWRGFTTKYVLKNHFPGCPCMNEKFLNLYRLRSSFQSVSSFFEGPS